MVRSVSNSKGIPKDFRQTFIFTLYFAYQKIFAKFGTGVGTWIVLDDDAEAGP